MDFKIPFTDITLSDPIPDRQDFAWAIKTVTGGTVDPDKVNMMDVYKSPLYAFEEIYKGEAGDVTQTGLIDTAKESVEATTDALGEAIQKAIDEAAAAANKATGELTKPILIMAVVLVIAAVAVGTAKTTAAGGGYKVGG